MLIKKLDKTRIVELEDGSLWRIWPGDIALTLNWLPTTDLRVSEIADGFCSHALIDQTGGSRVLRQSRRFSHFGRRLCCLWATACRNPPEDMAAPRHERNRGIETIRHIRS
jgi:hypothetical protein